MIQTASIVTVEPGVPPGEQLAAARVACKLSVADVARHLKLSPKQVEAMEADEYHLLPGAVFVRGFVRNYARLVRLDPAPLLAQAEQQLITAPRIVEEVQRSPDIPFPSGDKPRWHKYAIFAVLVVAALALFEFYWSGIDQGAEAPANTRPAAAAKTNADKSADNPDSTRNTRVVDSDAKQRGGAKAVTPADKGGGSVAAKAADTKAAALPGTAAAKAGASVERKPGEHLLRFTFDKDSWVEVRDRSGKRILSQSNAAGTTQAVSGQPPLTLVIGNAPGVKLTQNGQPVNLQPYINVHVARLTLE
jgi:cytoskeleton protein RodZ